MNFFRRQRKHTFGESEEPSINIFLIMVTVAAVGLTCLLLYAVLWPALFGDDEPEYEIVPFGGDPTNTPDIPIIVPTLTLAPTLTEVPPALPTVTAVPTGPITVANVDQVAALTTLTGHSNPVTSVAFSRDGRFVASGDMDGLVKVWDAKSLAELYTFRSASNRVASVAFSPDSSQIVAGGQDTLVRRWDLRTGSELTPLAGPSGAVTSLDYSQSLLAAGSDDAKVYLWNMPDGTILGVLAGHTSYVTSVAFSPDGSVLAAGGEDDSIRLWRVPNGNLLGILSGHSSAVTGLAFSPDGTTLASTSADRSVRLWNLLSQSQVATLTGHTENVNDVAFSPDGLILASAAGGIEDNAVRLWDVRTGQVLRVLYPGGPVNDVIFGPDGVGLVTGGATYVTLWGAADGVPVASAPTPTPQPSPLAPPGVLESGGGCVLTTRAPEATMRAGPGNDYNAVGALTLNQQVQATAWMTGAAGFTWWQLSNGAWVRGDVFIDASNRTFSQACLDLPAAQQTPAAPAGATIPPTLPLITGTPTGCALTVRVNEANVRAGPATSSEILSKLTLNQRVPSDGWTTGERGFTWWRLPSGGWVRGDVFIDAANRALPAECLALPAVTP